MIHSTYKSIYMNPVTSQPTTKKNKHLNRANRRLVILIGLFLALCLTFSGIVQAWTGDHALSETTKKPAVQVEHVIIQSGDTLWGIARTYLPSNSKYDIRDYISFIKKHNQMKNSSLQAGDVIEVPLLTTT